MGVQNGVHKTFLKGGSERSTERDAEIKRGPRAVPQWGPKRGPERGLKNKGLNIRAMFSLDNNETNISQSTSLCS